MVEISASMVKDLRERSGAAMMDCKKALVEAQGDFEKAFEWLRQKGVAVAQKKAARSASEGLVVAQVSADGKSGSIIEINCETDFVARNPEFVELAKQVSDVALASKSQSPEALLEQKIGSAKVSEFLTEKVAKTGENIVLRRLAVLDLKGGSGVIGLYVHALGGKMGALVELATNKPAAAEELNALGKDIAMHIVSAKPSYVSREEIDSEVIENERRIELGKADLAEKKPEMREKIVQGRVDKLLAERCLLDQSFVKDPNQTVGQFLKSKGASLGVEIKPVRFALYILGEIQAEIQEAVGAEA